jgi:hypothetical protein
VVPHARRLAGPRSAPGADRSHRLARPRAHQALHHGIYVGSSPHRAVRRRPLRQRACSDRRTCHYRRSLWAVAARRWTRLPPSPADKPAEECRSDQPETQSRRTRRPLRGLTRYYPANTCFGAGAGQGAPRRGPRSANRRSAIRDGLDTSLSDPSDSGGLQTLRPAARLRSCSAIRGDSGSGREAAARLRPRSTRPRRAAREMTALSDLDGRVLRATGAPIRAFAGEDRRTRGCPPDVAVSLMLRLPPALTRRGRHSTSVSKWTNAC